MLSTLDEELLEILCANDDLVRAEFDAIVDAAWGRGGGADDPPVPAPDGAPPRARRSGRGTTLVRRPRGPGTDGWARERSPPPPAGPGRTP
jgi:hypothetical protein